MTNDPSCRSSCLYNYLGRNNRKIEKNKGSEKKESLTEEKALTRVRDGREVGLDFCFGVVNFWLDAWLVYFAHTGSDF